MFDWLFGEEKALGPAMAQEIESGWQALPDVVQLQAWQGREQRNREERRADEETLYSGYSDADEIARSRVYEGQMDACVGEEERKAVMACLKRPGGLTPEQCMDAARDGVRTTGGAEQSTASRVTTDGTVDAAGAEVSATAELGPVPKTGVTGKGSASHATQHSDAVGSGSASTRNYSVGGGYKDRCEVKAQQAEDALRVVQEAQAPNIAAARILRDQTATPWKGPARP